MTISKSRLQQNFFSSSPNVRRCNLHCFSQKSLKMPWLLFSKSLKTQWFFFFFFVYHKFFRNLKKIYELWDRRMKPSYDFCITLKYILRMKPVMIFVLLWHPQFLVELFFIYELTNINLKFNSFLIQGQQCNNSVHGCRMTNLQSLMLLIRRSCYAPLLCHG